MSICHNYLSILVVILLIINFIQIEKLICCSVVERELFMKQPYDKSNLWLQIVILHQNCVHLRWHLIFNYSTAAFNYVRDSFNYTLPHTTIIPALYKSGLLLTVDSIPGLKVVYVKYVRD